MKKRGAFKPLIIGLTGGIGMGKSKAAEILSEFGLPIYSADDAVHRLLGKNGGAVKKVAKLFPDARRQNSIDRKILGHLVFGKPKELKKLERILHPLVRKEEVLFLRGVVRAAMPAAVLEIPLLFETGGEKRCDITLCVTAPRPVQMQRVLTRPGMTEARFRAIVRAQMPDLEKQKRADYIVRTGKNFADTKKQLQRILKTEGLI